MMPYLFLLAGLALIYIEFYLPGMIMGISGAFLLIVSVVLFAGQTDSVAILALYLLGMITAVGLLIHTTLRRIKKNASKQTIYLDSDQEGYVASTFASEAIGKTGVALTDLKPSGHALIEGKRLQVLSQAGYITAGTEIQVIRGQGAHLVVKPKEVQK